MSSLFYRYTDWMLQGQPIVICNKGDEETKKHAYKVIEVPDQVDCLQGILTIIPMQLLSLHIAELRKCDVSSFVTFICFCWKDIIEGSMMFRPVEGIKKWDRLKLSCLDSITMGSERLLWILDSECLVTWQRTSIFWAAGWTLCCYGSGCRFIWWTATGSFNDQLQVHLMSS